MADYTSDVSINSPDVGQPDINAGYEQKKQNIQNFVSLAQNVGTRLLTQHAKDQAPEDVQNGTFKELPALSPLAEAYNNVGQQFEQNTARMQLQQTAQNLQSDLINAKMKAGLPIETQDIDDFKNNYNTVVNGVVNKMSPASRPYVQNMADLFGNQASVSIQNHVNTQNRALTQYGFISNMNNLNQSAADAIQRKDYNAGFNLLLQGQQAAENPNNALLLGPKSAANLTQTNKIKQASMMGYALGNGDINQEDAGKLIQSLGSQLNFSPENIAHATSSFNSARAQQAQSIGITASTVFKGLSNIQQNLETGNNISDDQLSALSLQVNKLPGAAGITYSHQLASIQQAKETIGALKYAPLETRQAEIQALHKNALSSTDPNYIRGAQIAIKGLTNIDQMAVANPAAYALGAPPIQNLINQNQMNLASQKAAGHQFQTSDFNVNVPQAIINYQQANKLPLAVIPNDAAKDKVSQLVSNDFPSSVKDLQNFLSYYQKTGTDAYAKNDLLKNGLPPQYLLALPMQNSAYKEVFNAAMSDNYKPGTTQNVNKDTWKSIQTNVDTQLKSFVNASLNIDIANPSVVNSATAYAVKRYAAGLVEKGMNASDAAQKATNDLVNGSYNIKDNLLIPKSYDPNMVLDNLNQHKQNLINALSDKSGDRENNSLGNRFYYANDTDRYQAAIQASNSHWILNAQHTGYVLADPSGMVIKDKGANRYAVQLQDMKPIPKPLVKNDSQSYGSTASTPTTLPTVSTDSGKKNSLLDTAKQTSSSNYMG